MGGGAETGREDGVVATVGDLEADLRRQLFSGGDGCGRNDKWGWSSERFVVNEQDTYSFAASALLCRLLPSFNYEDWVVELGRRS